MDKARSQLIQIQTTARVVLVWQLSIQQRRQNKTKSADNEVVPTRKSETTHEVPNALQGRYFTSTRTVARSSSSKHHIAVTPFVALRSSWACAAYLIRKNAAFYD
jgi:hypothetical protein